MNLRGEKVLPHPLLAAPVCTPCLHLAPVRLFPAVAVFSRWLITILNPSQVLLVPANCCFHPTVARSMPYRMLDSISTNYEGHHVSWRERLSHFTWSWFECTMSTGAMATLLSQQPYTFDGLKTIGKVFFILDLILFISFSILITLRFCLNNGALSRSLHHGHESFYFGTFWVSIALIIYSIQAYAVPSCGHWLVTTLEVLFWLYAGCVMVVAIFREFFRGFLTFRGLSCTCTYPWTATVSGLGYDTLFIPR